MITIVIPMAGAGRRFAEAGYALPKPFIDVMGEPMIKRVMENLAVPEAHYFLLAQRDHAIAHPEVFASLSASFPITVVSLDGLTEGAACTVLRAVRHLNTETPLLMANSDQLVAVSMADFVADSDSRNLDGSILTFPTSDPKWSFARTGDDGLVIEVAEKRPISEHATVGIYYWRRGRDFVESAVEMISHNDRTNNEFYTCPAYNYALAAGARIGIYEIQPSQMHGLGTPEDLTAYLAYSQERVS